MTPMVRLSVVPNGVRHSASVSVLGEVGEGAGALLKPLRECFRLSARRGRPRLGFHRDRTHRHFLLSLLNASSATPDRNHYEQPPTTNHQLPTTNRNYFVAVF
jgi:hypothetical protein